MMTAEKISSARRTLDPQTDDLRLLSDEERAKVIISAVKIDGTLITMSQYGDDVWRLTGGTTNRNLSHKQLDFRQVPSDFRTVTKEIMYRYLRRGRLGAKKPSTTTAFGAFTYLIPFLRHIGNLKVRNLGEITPSICSAYVEVCRAARLTKKIGISPISTGTLEKRLSVVELIHELSQFTLTPMLIHPWPESSARFLAGLAGKKHHISKTALIPDEVFTELFQAAWNLVQDGDALLAQRESLGELTSNVDRASRHWYKKTMNQCLYDLGWKEGFRKFNKALTDLRTACYIIIASLSGCRNHELAYIQNGAYYPSVDDEGVTFWWMRSRSEKTGQGITEWMIPEAAVKALKIMERWAAPLQADLAEEIVQRRAENPKDFEIAEAQKHMNALFLTVVKDGDSKVRTLSNSAWNIALKEFAKTNKLNWNITTHQFRRKFANYVARNKFGDLRYLREHFKHWSQDMTNDGYALNESQEIELYAEILDELDGLKHGVVERWLHPNEALAGSYGLNLVAWRSREESISIFKDHKTMVRSIADSHAIRSNGHAWCTADDYKCIGNSFERTRCADCNNSVIDRTHAVVYQRLHEELQNVAACDDIGPSGQIRVRRDIERCRSVLVSLGYDPEAKCV